MLDINKGWRLLRAHHHQLLVIEDSARLTDRAGVASYVVHRMETHLLSLVVGVVA